MYFNSIKVRLEHAFVQDFRKFKLFQFHKGTIRTSVKDKEEKERLDNFNSIKVRLEQTIFILTKLIRPISIP